MMDGIDDVIESMERFADRHWMHDEGQNVREFAQRLRAAKKNQQVGNAAAMREALATLRKRFDNNTMAYQDRYFKFSGWNWHKKAKEAARWRDVFHELREVCDAALSAPARNCDLYKNKKDAEAAFISEKCKHPCGNCTVDDKYGCALVHECGVDWLLAPAAERKGEDKK